MPWLSSGSIRVLTVPQQEAPNTLYLDHDGQDERLAVELFEKMPLGNLPNDSAEVDPVGDMPFLRGKHFCYFFV